MKAKSMQVKKLIYNSLTMQTRESQLCQRETKIINKDEKKANNPPNVFKDFSNKTLQPIYNIQQIK